MRMLPVALLLGATAACRDRAPPQDLSPPRDTRPVSPSPSSSLSISISSSSSPSDASAAEWPALPTTAEARSTLIGRFTVTTPRGDAGVDVPIGAALDAAAYRGWSRQVAGYDAIRATLERWLAEAEQAGHVAYLLVGTMHDSAGHVEAFRRLVGPGGVRGFTHVVLEQFRADGAWEGVTLDDQRGDGALVEEWQAHGDASTFEALAHFHADHDYAAWKFGYADRVMDLLVAGRAAGTPVLPCDMSPALQARVTGARPSEELDRIRELHCVFALRDAVARLPPRDGKPHVAMLWGTAHVRPEALPRFLPAEASVMTIHVFGQRPGHQAPDRIIGERLVLNDPVLVSLDAAGRERALLLPEATVDVDRVRRHEPMDGPVSYVRVRADAAGRFTIDDHAPEPIGTAVSAIKIVPGPHTYAFEVGEGARKVTVVGALDVPPSGSAEVSFDRLLDPKQRTTRVEYVTPK